MIQFDADLRLIDREVISIATNPLSHIRWGVAHVLRGLQHVALLAPGVAELKRQTPRE